MSTLSKSEKDQRKAERQLNRAPRKRKLTAAERFQLRRERKHKYMTIFVNGKQKRVARPLLIEGSPVGKFIARNADLIWMHQNEMWESMAAVDET